MESSPQAYKEYWIVTIMRGLLAVLTATAVIFTSALNSTVILMPAGVVIEILCLGAYATIDSALVLMSSFTIPRRRPGRVALQLQGTCGAVIGLFLFSLVYKRLDLHWFIYLFAIQAAATAVTEFIVARGTSEHHKAMWCYASSAIAAVSAVTLVVSRGLSGWLIYAYLCILGFNLIGLSARMLFAERRSHANQGA